MRTLSVTVLVFGLVLACSKKGPVGTACKDSDDCKDDICAFGIAADPVCTKQCKGNGEPGQCPSGWKCSGTAAVLGESAGNSAMSICVPEVSAQQPTPTEKAIGGGDGERRSVKEQVDALKRGPAGRYLPTDAGAL